MHFTPPIFRQILQWILVVAMVAVFGVCQDTVSAPDRVNHIYEVEQSTGQIVSDSFVGTRLKGAATIASKGGAGWSLIGVADFVPKSSKGMVYFEASTGKLEGMFYGGAPGAQWSGTRSLCTPA